MLFAGTYMGMDLLTSSKTFLPNIGGVLPSKIIEVRPEHSEKAASPILFTELGIVIEVKESQALKASFPILFTELGIVIEVRLLQPPKAPSPILFTELGIVIEVRPEQS